MERIEAIVKIEARAKFLNLTPTAAYRKAGVSANSFSRWKLNRNSPNLRTFNIAIGKVDAFLDAEEKRLRGETAPSAADQGEAA